MARQTTRNKWIFGAFGCLIGSTLGAEVGILSGSPFWSIATGGALGSACGALVASGRMLPTVACLAFAVPCVTVICFNGTPNSVVGGLLMGAVGGAVVSQLPRAMTFCLLGGLFGMAVVMIPYSSYGRRISDCLVGEPQQLAFVLTMSFAGLGVWFLFRCLANGVSGETKKRDVAF